MQKQMLACVVCLGSLAGCSTTEIPWVMTGGSGGAGVESLGTGGGSGGWPANTGGLPDMGGSASEGLGGAGSGFYDIVAVSEQGDILGLGVTDEHVYWITYGTMNSVTGKYNLDGALHRRAIDGGETETILEGLEGPTRLQVTTKEAFVWLAKSAKGTKHDGMGFGRVSLEGGELEALGGPAGSTPFYFDAWEDRAYLHHDADDEAESGIYEYVAGQPPRQVVQITEYDFVHFAVDGTYVYFTGPDGTQRSLLAGSTPELLNGLYMGYDVGTAGKLLAMSELFGPWELFSLPDGGGEWESVLVLPPPRDTQSYEGFSVVGERWFATMLLQGTGSGFHFAIYTGEVDDWVAEEIPNVLPESNLWRATETDFFRASGDALVHIPLE